MGDRRASSRPPSSAPRGPGALEGPFATSAIVPLAATAVGVIAVVGLFGDLSVRNALLFFVGASTITAVATWAARALELGVRRDVADATRLVEGLGASLRDKTDLELDADGEATPPSGTELSNAAANLSARFAEVARAERRASTAVERAKRARGLLFAGVSHDLKSPLNALLGFADLLSMEQLTDGQRESVEIISSRGRELVALVETILDAARVEMGQLGITKRATNLTEVLEEAREKASALAHVGTGVEIRTQGELPIIAADAVHLTRAFALVIAHALKSSASATPSEGVAGGGVSVPPEAVFVRVRRAGDDLRVDVEHRREGPTAAALEELYFSTGRGRGLRLGLRLARTIFELHGGRIEVLERTNGRPSVACFVPATPPPPEDVDEP